MAIWLAVACVWGGAAHATIFRVPLFYPSIQSAIQASASGDTVLVERGTYYETIDFLGRQIVVTSQYFFTGDTADIAQTIIRPGSNSNVPLATFTNGETRAAKLSGFTLTGGTAMMGGGVHCEDSSPALEDLWIFSNHALQEGGGIYAMGGAPLIHHCRIAQNLTGGDGGGINSVYSLVEVRDCDIYGNHCGSRGAGIFCENCTMIIDGNRIYQNVVSGTNAYNGGGITSRNCEPLITNNLIVENDGAGYGGGMFY